MTKTFAECIPQCQGGSVLFVLCFSAKFEKKKEKRIQFILVPYMVLKFLIMCEDNMYIVQIKKCSNVMKNKATRKDDLS